jgi:DNA-binding transcriptional regulator YhcF (GntR family)
MFEEQYNMDALTLDLDASRDTPLYRQLTEALRYRISSGTLRAGTRLPTLKMGAALWGVNLHTVRRAFLALQEAGLVEVKRPTGTFVAPQGGGSPPREAQRFVMEAMEEARRRFGLEGRAFAAMALEVVEPRPVPALHVVECSLPLAESLARQLHGRWGRETTPLHLDDLKEMGPGPVVATYFHYNEVRAAIPQRLADLHFISISPDP